MKKIEKISLVNLKNLSRNQMRSIMAGSAGDCELPNVRCGLNGEGRCDVSSNDCVCNVGGRVASDSHCKV
ncbi:hypothetical protein SAMN04487979_13417 [Flavobacterium sp. ov086]|nr:hypothetical protein SAMN04487979_13417 [Flavobacterium sp. ov086]